jgi:hypothetical protein
MALADAPPAIVDRVERGHAGSMRTPLLVAAVLSVVHTLPAPFAEADQPPLQLDIAVDGVRHAAIDGEELTLTVAGKPTKVKVSVAATRRFRAAGVEFDFPRAMGFSHDASEGLEMWTLDGDDVTVMLHRFSIGEAGAMAKSTLVGMSESLGGKAKEPEPCMIVLGGKDHAGLRSRVTIGNTATLETIAIGIPRSEGCLLLLIQDSLGDDGKSSAQCTAMVELLAKTFAFAK